MLCTIVCGAEPTSDVGRLITLAQADDWRVAIVATPSALPFLDVRGTEVVTGNPVRSRYSKPGQPRAHSASRADAVLVAPATFNTVVKMAAGICDNYALGVVAEAIGLGKPVTVVPFVNTALASRAPFRLAVEQLRAEGVSVLHGPGGWEAHEPGSGGDSRSAFPWAAALRDLAGSP
jgi:phosphopantothenoylcysteine synthetase/decarboxylase